MGSTLQNPRSKGSMDAKTVVKHTRHSGWTVGRLRSVLSCLEYEQPREPGLQSARRPLRPSRSHPEGPGQDCHMHMCPEAQPHWRT